MFFKTFKYLKLLKGMTYTFVVSKSTFNIFSIVNSILFEQNNITYVCFKILVQSYCTMKSVECQFLKKIRFKYSTYKKV